jgi:hypothetical protein
MAAVVGIHGIREVGNLQGLTESGNEILGTTTRMCSVYKGVMRNAKPENSKKRTSCAAKRKD